MLATSQYIWADLDGANLREAFLGGPRESKQWGEGLITGFGLYAGSLCWAFSDVLLFRNSGFVVTVMVSGKAVLSSHDAQLQVLLWASGRALRVMIFQLHHSPLWRFSSSGHCFLSQWTQKASHSEPPVFWGLTPPHFRPLLAKRLLQWTAIKTGTLFFITFFLPPCYYINSAFTPFCTCSQFWYTRLYISDCRHINNILNSEGIKKVNPFHYPGHSVFYLFFFWPEAEVGYENLEGFFLNYFTVRCCLGLWFYFGESALYVFSDKKKHRAIPAGITFVVMVDPKARAVLWKDITEFVSVFAC